MAFGDWKRKQEKNNNNEHNYHHRQATCFLKHPLSLTALADGSVILDVVFLATAGAAADCCPVDCVHEAELLVPSDVHSAVINVAQRAQPQGGQGGAPYHHQRVEPENMTIQRIC